MSDPDLVKASRVQDDAQYEAGLRPRALDDYIGQDRVRENLQVSIAAARRRGEPLDHVLFFGPRASARRPWLTSSPRRWASRSKRPGARRSRRAIWPAS